MASYQEMFLGKFQKVEFVMFGKKYSPVVLSKASLRALRITEKMLRFVLQDEMIDFLHLTLDEARRDESRDLACYEAEISGTVECRNAKTVEFEANIDLRRKRNVADWTCESSQSLEFPLVHTKIGLEFVHGTERVQSLHLGKELGMTVHQPQDEIFLGLRKKLVG